MFKRVNYAGWPIHSKLTSAQANALDIQLAKAIDKTGDTVTTGTTTWASGAVLDLQAGGIAKLTGGTVTDLVGSAMGQSSLTIRDDGQMLITDGALMTITGASSTVTTGFGGRVQMGDGDYPEFSATRSVVRWIDLGQTGGVATSGTWTFDSTGVIGPSGVGGGSIIVPIHSMHDGANLASIEVFFTPTIGHAGLPATNIQFEFLVRSMTSGATLPVRSIEAFANYSPVSLANYNNAQVKSKVITISSDFVDRGAREYAVEIDEESGANALGLTTFHAMKLTYDSIADMRIP